MKYSTIDSLNVSNNPVIKYFIFNFGLYNLYIETASLNKQQGVIVSVGKINKLVAGITDGLAFKCFIHLPVINFRQPAQVSRQISCLKVGRSTRSVEIVE
jgi:hypothetical protein